MAPPYPLSNPTAWNRSTIGGKVMPGRTVVKGLDNEITVQHDKARGKDGGDDVITGLKRPAFTIELHLTPISRESGESRRAAGERVWNEFWSVADMLLPQKRPGARDYLAIEYPSVNAARITHILVQKIQYPEPESGKVPVAILHVVAARPPSTSTTTATHKPSKQNPPTAASVPTIDRPTRAIVAQDLRDRVKRPSADVKL